MSRGHRFLCKEEVEIKSPETYKETMRKAFVIADQDERRALITAGLQKTAKELGAGLAQCGSPGRNQLSGGVSDAALWPH